MIKDKLKNFLPNFFLFYYRQIRIFYKKLRYKGNLFFCNICNSNLSLWSNYGPLENLNFICPVCNAFGRHRMLALILNDELNANNFYPKKHLLHFSPEIGLQKYITTKFFSIDYKSSDYEDPNNDFQFDLMNIDHPNDRFDYIIISHVLEHIHDDIRALKELRRILSPGGKIFIQVPLGNNPQIIEKKLFSAQERLVMYGQKDHVRLYSKNALYQRLVDVGFAVSVQQANEQNNEKQFYHMALDIPQDSKMLYSTESTVFVCQKPY